MWEPIDAVTTSSTDRMQRTRDFAMRAFCFIAAAILLTIAPTMRLAPAGAQSFFGAAVPNNTPLTFGMDANDVSLVLGTQLIYIRGRPGNELHLALPNVKGSALSSRRDGL